MNVTVKRMLSNAKLPVYERSGSACFDLYSAVDYRLYPGDVGLIGTGLSFDIPEGWALKIYSRTGHGFLRQISLANSTGIIDSDYKGEIKVGLVNNGDQDFSIRSGDKIAKGMLVRVEPISFQEVDNHLY